MPCEPVLRGPFCPLAFAASSALAFASEDISTRSFDLIIDILPAFCFSWKALSSSSNSAFGAFFGALSGLALPPVQWG
jgi:hypothetical protein